MTSHRFWLDVHSWVLRHNKILQDFAQNKFGPPPREARFSKMFSILGVAQIYFLWKTLPNHASRVANLVQEVSFFLLWFRVLGGLKIYLPPGNKIYQDVARFFANIIWAPTPEQRFWQPGPLPQQKDSTGAALLGCHPSSRWLVRICRLTTECK